MRRLLLPVVLVAALALPGPARAGAGVEGRVSWAGRGVAGALVQAFRKAEQDPATPAVAEAASGEDGAYRLDLPAGRYWIWARATVTEAGRERRLAGPSAANPVDVSGDRTARADVALADPSGLSGSAPPGAGVRGRVEGAPPTEVMVYVYPGRGERPTGPGFAAAVAPGPDGTFEAHLLPGEYTVAARWRASGQPFGQLVPGDRVAVAEARVAQGRYADVGPLGLRPVDEAVWRSVRRASPPSGTWIEGVVATADGSPAGGLHVLAFTDPRMAGKPAALSPATGPDGRFRLHVPGAGTYYLGARSHLGGPAQPGERVGAYRGEEGAGVAVAEGEHRAGVEIRVEEVW